MCLTVAKIFLLKITSNIKFFIKTNTGNDRGTSQILGFVQLRGKVIFYKKN